MVLIRSNLIDGDRETTAKVDKAVRQKSSEKFVSPPVPWAKLPAPRPSTKSPAPRKSAKPGTWEARSQTQTTPSTSSPKKTPQPENNRSVMERLRKPKKIRSVEQQDSRKYVVGGPHIPAPRYGETELDRRLLKMAPGGGGSIAFMGDAKLTREGKETEAEKKKRIEKSNKEFEARQVRNRPGNGDHREMSWEDYEALSPAHRAAVDANSILIEAVEKDKAFISELDQNKDGRVTSAEAKAKDTYGRNYEALFGPPGFARSVNYTKGKGVSYSAPGDDVTYAPNTLAALRLLEQGGFTVDEGDTIDNFLNGGRYVTALDMEEGLASTETPATRTSANLSGSMARLSKALEDGMAIVNGAQGASVSLKYTSPEQQAKLVENIQADMLAGGSFEAAFNPESLDTPVSLGALYDGGPSQRFSGYQWMMDQILSDPGASMEAKLNTFDSEEEMQRFASQIGIDFDMSEWTDLVKLRVQKKDEEE